MERRSFALVKIHINAASSLDGKISLRGGRRVLLSGPEDLLRVHTIRSQVDAVLVGVGTVLKDDPSLLPDPRILGEEPRRNPFRVVLDSNLRTPPSSRILDGRSPTFLYTHVRSGPVGNATAVQVPPSSEGVSIAHVLEDLESRGVGSLLVEGGGRVIRSFIEGGFFDLFTLYVAPLLLGEEGATPLFPGPSAETRKEAGVLEVQKVEKLGEGVLLVLGKRG